MITKQERGVGSTSKGHFMSALARTERRSLTTTRILGSTLKQDTREAHQAHQRMKHVEEERVQMFAGRVIRAFVTRR